MFNGSAPWFITDVWFYHHVQRFLMEFYGVSLSWNVWLLYPQQAELGELAGAERVGGVQQHKRLKASLQKQMQQQQSKMEEVRIWLLSLLARKWEYSSGSKRSAVWPLCELCCDGTTYLRIRPPPCGPFLYSKSISHFLYRVNFRYISTARYFSFKTNCPSNVL